MKRSRLIVGLIIAIPAVSVLLYLRVGWIWTLIQLVVWPLIIEVVGGKLEKRAPDNLPETRSLMVSPLNLIGWWSLRKHLKEQAENIRRMPFVFKDVVGVEDLLDNFIDPDTTNIDLRSYDPRPKPPASTHTYIDTLRDNRKAILLGQAGVGKTTFQRHTVLTVIKTPDTVKYLVQGEKVVPVYIQLRLVDNSRPFPLHRYLHEKIPYLSGKWGNRRLNKLASAGQLFLFLDGYDETPFTLPQQSIQSKEGARNAGHGSTVAPVNSPAEQTNYLRDELKLLMSPNMSRIVTQAGQPPAIVEFYRQLQVCRVWLTSRKDFFLDQTPFAQHEIPNTGLAALEITGVDSRQKLIEKMFAKYKLIQEHPDLFEPSLFFNLINRDIGELQKLSNNPLLLIIICSIYAHEVVRTRNPRVQIANTLDAIIEKYLYLLLEGLDEGRNEDLKSPAKKEWQKEGRGLYISEKREFLEYFAARLFIENIATFSKQFIYEKARTFFTNESASPNKLEILRGFEQRPGPYDFVGQINNSGILVVAEGIRKKDYRYDFPHQRFRELLAAQYFENHSFDFIIQNLHQPALKGLLYVFFRITAHKDDIIVALLDRIAIDPKYTEYYLRIFSSCLEQNPDYKPKEAFKRFFSKCIDSDILFDIPRELRPGLESKEYFDPDYLFKLRLAGCFKDNTKAGFNSMKLSGDLLLMYEKSLLGFTIEEFFNQSDKALNAEAFLRRAEWRYKCDPDSAKEYFKYLFWQYLRRSNKHNLELCSQFIRDHDHLLLTELFTSALSSAIEHSIASKDLATIPETASLLHEIDKGLLNSIMAKELLSRVRRNVFALVPHWLIELYKPDIAFEDAWAEALRESLDEHKIHSLILALELARHYGGGLKTKAERLLLPALKEGQEFVIQLAADSPRINHYISQLSQEDAIANEILALTNLNGKITWTVLNLPESMASHPRHCYILTQEDIKRVRQYADEHEVDVARRDWTKLYRLIFQVLSKERLIEEIPSSLDESVVKMLIDLSKFNYAQYELVAKALSHNGGEINATLRTARFVYDYAQRTPGPIGKLP